MSLKIYNFEYKISLSGESTRVVIPSYWDFVPKINVFNFQEITGYTSDMRGVSSDLWLRSDYFKFNEHGIESDKMIKGV